MNTFEREARSLIKRRELIAKAEALESFARFLTCQIEHCEKVGDYQKGTGYVDALVEINKRLETLIKEFYELKNESGP